ncbi:LacI family DNA-binding transcriptional regulator [Ornithobacterium rhinotracheale]|uniref:LacI family DNA-binding transcriptional regulator n=1 Tax=Ornithobacterium rhinotracheale TaxID=28251 RepID=UPI001FF398C0|nr:LacI family DNA-binding transcriptional regulator [Ornithobacterium rhinotracheale]MCK0203565.1 LacI family DNA-binding transcriptional regulator [Ornithobacterium rhinotracheale]
MNKIQKIKEKIPYGGLKKIAKRAGVHYITLVLFFNGKRTMSEVTELKVLNATAQYLEEIKNAKITAIKKINTL